MGIEDYRKKIDIFMTLFITYFFVICLSFEYITVQGNYENYIMLTLAMIVALISYYTNITFSLISVLVVDFGYASYRLYRNIVQGVSVDIRVYYWVIIIPIAAVVVTVLARYILELQIQLNKANTDNKNLVMIDETTGIRNSSALFNEIPIYMNMCKRHKIPVAIMLVRFKYSRKLKSIVGKDFFKEIITECSEILEDSLRLEDRKYILNEESTFAFILISDESGCEVVKKRFKENVERINLDKNSLFKGLKLEIQVGYYSYNNDIKDAMDFVARAEMEIDYDV
ncbi:diguanylate cyclase domain-containing protein [Clostridium thailandense]|uniref:diguanylate cyclase domain-containing protein n=1 Tax=Clostridium thailandense TaxID=2794346 RepID=UPI003988C70B